MTYQLLVDPRIYEKPNAICAITVKLLLSGQHHCQASRRQYSITTPEDHQPPGKHIFYIGMYRRTPGVAAVVRINVADLEMTTTPQYMRAGGQVGWDAFHCKSAVVHLARIEQMCSHIG